MEDKSSDERKRIWDSAVVKAFHSEADLPLDLIYSDQYVKETFRRLSDMLHNTTATEDDESITMLRKIRELAETLAKPTFSNIVIEEPELNLFPATQAELMYYVLSKINHSRDNMVITTHRPYILYAVNNCILANLVKEKLDE